MEARQYRELLDIQAVSICSIDHYKFMTKRYDGMIYPETKKLPPPAPGPVIDAGSKEAKILLTGAFKKLKRSLGHGR